MSTQQWAFQFHKSGEFLASWATTNFSRMILNRSVTGDGKWFQVCPEQLYEKALVVIVSVFAVRQTAFDVLRRLAPYTTFRFVTFCQTNIAVAKGEKNRIFAQAIWFISLVPPTFCFSSQFSWALLSFYNIFDLSTYFLTSKISLGNTTVTMNLSWCPMQSVR